MSNSQETTIINTQLRQYATYADFLAAATGRTPFTGMVLTSEINGGFSTVYAWDGAGGITRITASGVAPGIPTSLAGTVGTTSQINLSWTAPVFLGSNAIVDYLVEYKLTSSGTWLTFSHTPSTATSIAVTGLTDGLSYDFRVSASNSDATSSPSTPITRTPSQLPGTPTALAATNAENTQTVVTWTAPTSGGNPITDYSIQYRVTGTSSWTAWSHAPSTSTTATITGLTNETSYDIQVAAINSNGTGAYASFVNAIPETFIFFISQVSGSDANNGTSRLTPVLTLSRLQSLMVAYGTGASVLFLEAGFYYEQLDLSTTNGAIVNANYSTFDAAGKVTPGSWTVADPTNYPNVWSMPWTSVQAIQQGAVMTVDNALPTFCTTLSACNANSFSYYVNPSDLLFIGGPNPFTMYVNTGTNPNTDGKAYEIMTRSYGIIMNDNSIMRNAVTKTAINNNGSGFIAANAIVTKSMFSFGHKHNMYARSGTIEDCVAYDFDGFPSGNGPYVFNNSLTVPTYSGRVSRCIVTAPYNRNISSGAFYSHGGGVTPYINLTIDGSIVYNCISFGTPSAQNYTITNSHQSGGQSPALSATMTVSNYTMEHANTNSSMIYPNGTSSWTDCAFYVGIVNTQPLVTFQNWANGSAFSMTNCTMAGGNVQGWYNVSTNTGSVALNYNVFAYEPNIRKSILVNSQQTYTGDHNVFYGNSNQLRCSYNGTAYTTLSAWQAATGQDANSCYLTPTQRANFFIGNIATGDFRINPSAQVTSASGTVYTGTFPDGTPITSAGAQNHYDFNTRTSKAGAPVSFPNVPATYANCLTYIANPLAWTF